MTSRMARTREQTEHGLNLCPISRSRRGTKGAAKSPWSKGPMVNSDSARKVFARNQRITKRTNR